MADSDHSMRCAYVTRRVALLGSAAVAGGSLGNAAQAIAHSLADDASPSIEPNAPLDPVIALWREWAAVHARVQELSQRLQDLEVELAERFDSFGTIVPVPGDKPAYVYSLTNLHRLVGDRTDMADIQAQAEQAAFTDAKMLLDRMTTTAATSLAGVASKLDAIGRWGEAWDEHPKKFPWPQIHSAHADVVRLGKQIAPTASYPSGNG